MTRWEYKIEYPSFSGYTSEKVSYLNNQGKDRWELITIDQKDGWMFKRPIKGD